MSLFSLAPLTHAAEPEQRVNSGEWVDLGGAVESTNEIIRQILSTRSSTDSEDSRFLIRVDPQ